MGARAMLQPMSLKKALLPLIAALAAATAVHAEPQNHGKGAVQSQVHTLAERFAALGLQPMGGKSYLTPIHRVEQQLVAERSKAALTTGQAVQPLNVGRDL